MHVRCSLLAIHALALGIPALATAQAVAQAPAQVEVRGIITDVSRVPIGGVEIAAVVAMSLLRQTLSAENGSFNIGVLPAGQVQLRIRRLGFEPRVVEIQVGSDALAPLDIMLKPRPADLEGVLIEANANDQSRLREFNEHRAQRNSYAKFYDQAEIRKKGSTNTSELFRSLPGITIKAANTGGNTIRIRGCQPMVWLDGQRVPGAELDEVITPGDIAGIEFYTSTAGTPAQYMERTNRACGTVLVWTKNY
jgi:hypothetical protein